MRKNLFLIIFPGLLVLPFLYSPAHGLSDVFKDNVYNPGKLKPTDSVLKVRVGDRAPDFMLPAVSGGKISLSRYLGKKNVVILINLKD